MHGSSFKFIRMQGSDFIRNEFFNLIVIFVSSLLLKTHGIIFYSWILRTFPGPFFISDLGSGSGFKTAETDPKLVGSAALDLYEFKTPHSIIAR